MAAEPQPKARPELPGPEKLVGLFSLESGALLESATGSLREHETTLFRGLWNQLKAGGVLLGDRGFCSYLNLAALVQRGVDSVMRLPPGPAH